MTVKPQAVHESEFKLPKCTVGTCKNCKHWERNNREDDDFYPDEEFDVMEEDKFGKCKNECFLYFTSRTST